MVQPLHTSEKVTALIIFSVILIYYLYHYTSHSSGICRFIRKIISGEKQQELAVFLFRKLGGFIIMGIIPGILWYFLIEPGFTRFGLTPEYLYKEINIILILSTIIASITFLHQKFRFEHNSLQMNFSDWNLPIFIINCFGWILYLTGYELLFRGILLTVCYSSFGFWPAIAINVCIYSAIHMVYGKKETFGALIFGTLACYFALNQGTVLIPLFMHITLSLFTDFFSLTMNRKLNYATFRPSKTWANE